MPTVSAPLYLPDLTDRANFNNNAQYWFNTYFPTYVAEVNAAFASISIVSTSDTSATSNIIGTGSKTFTVSSGKSFFSGMYLNIVNTAAPTTNGMFCQVVSYSGSTLVVTVLAIKGSGTFTAWSISLSAFGGAGLGANNDITSLGALTGDVRIGGTGILGYKAGSGGSVTQLTSKSTPVTLNKQSGKIIMHNQALASGSRVGFVLNSTFITNSESITVNVDGSAIANSAANYQVTANILSGSAYIQVVNVTGASLSEAIQINFVIFGGTAT